MCIRQRIEGSNPSLTAIFEIRARTKVRAFFFCILPRGRDENPRLRVRQLPTASWTDCERSERAARRASAASQSLPVLDATPCGLKRRVALTLTRPTKPKPSLDPVGLISAAPSGVFAKCGTVRSAYRVALALTRPTKPKTSLDPVGLISAAPSGVFAKCGTVRSAYRVALALTRPTKPKPSLDPVGLISAAPSGIFAKCGTVLPGPLTLTLSPGEREQSNKTQTHSLLNHPRILPGQKIHQRSDGR